MSRPLFLARILAFAGAMTVLACSQSPMEPSASGTTATSSLSALQSLPGLYWLTFHDNDGVEVPSLPVLNELVLKAHVTDTSGQPAQSGSVIFEYCSFRGLPTNDITRADEAPMSECAAGNARW